MAARRGSTARRGGPGTLTQSSLVNGRTRRDGAVFRFIQSSRGCPYPCSKPRGGVAVVELASFREVRQIHAERPPRREKGRPPLDSEFRRRQIWGPASRSEQRTQHFRPEITQTKHESAGSGALCLLPESIKLAECSKGSRISPIFPVLFVDPPEERSNPHA